MKYLSREIKPKPTSQYMLNRISGIGYIYEKTDKGVIIYCSLNGHYFICPIGEGYGAGWFITPWHCVPNKKEPDLTFYSTYDELRENNLKLIDGHIILRAPNDDVVDRFSYRSLSMWEQLIRRGDTNYDEIIECFPRKECIEYIEYIKKLS